MTQPDFIAIDDLDGDYLAALGWRRDSDFFAQDRTQRQAELMRALGADCFKPTANPAPARPPRRRRKPSLARLVAKAKQLGVDVTIEPNGTATFRTGGSSVSLDQPEADLAEWIEKHAH